MFSLLGEASIPLIPISSNRDLRRCIEALAEQQSYKSNSDKSTTFESLHDLASHCVRGKPMSRDQVNVLTGVSSGFRDIAMHITAPESQHTLKDFLGQADSERFISFFIDGPVSADL